MMPSEIDIVHKVQATDIKVPDKVKTGVDVSDKIDAEILNNVETISAEVLDKSVKDSSVENKKKATVEDASENFSKGKRHLFVNDIFAAVNSLQEAARLYAELYGETGQQCGDVYFFYGKALLELARIENGVLRNPLDGDEGSTEGEYESSQDEDEPSQDDNDDPGQDEDEPEQDNEDEPSQDEEEEEEESKEPEGDQTEDDEDVDNLQLAWEMLELSKLIYLKQEKDDDKSKLKMAEIHLKLGEVGLESENYPQSIEDLTSCLNIQTNLLENDDRRIAETNYQLGVAHSFSDDFDNSILNFSAAAKVIETRVDNLEAKIDHLKALTDEQRALREKEDQPMLHIQSEIDELANLLPEVREKLVDMTQMKMDSKEKLQKFKDDGTKCEAAFAGMLGGCKEDGSSATGFCGVSPECCDVKPISNISHLVKKKRKPEEELTPSEVKKTKGTNEEAVSNGKTSNDNKAKSTTEREATAKQEL